MTAKRVLHFGVQGGIGGVERFVYDLYRHINREKIQFDFLTRVDGNVAFSDEIEKLGGGI
ncbi:MAG: hypothetical protein LUH47_06915 [Clostridiales bacterium]|nr:hypothetical protein [Clostridiales bacterium]